MLHRRLIRHINSRFQTNIGFPCKIRSFSSDAIILNGIEIAEKRREVLKQEITELTGKSNVHPKLAIILVGNRKDSISYVKSKSQACREVGILTEDHYLDEKISQEELENIVLSLSRRVDIHGILVQIPLPQHIHTSNIIEAISLYKDVDGLHPYNAGKLSLKSCNPLFIPCTPLGCLALIDETKINIQGKVAVVLGRSDLVGNPVTSLLKQRNVTVIQCHSYTHKIEQYVSMADILIAACGHPNYVRGSWIKPGSIVIDVGINYIKNEKTLSGYELVGDVCFSEVQRVAGFLTTVPGGVGPMTIQMLLENTIKAYHLQIKKVDSL